MPVEMVANVVAKDRQGHDGDGVSSSTDASKAIR